MHITGAPEHALQISIPFALLPRGQMLTSRIVIHIFTSLISHLAHLSEVCMSAAWLLPLQSVDTLLVLL